MNSLKALIDAAVDKVVVGGNIERTIDAALEKVIVDAIHQNLRLHSELGAVISDKIRRAIGINLDQLTLPEYNNIVADVVLRKVEEHFNSEGRQDLDDVLSRFLTQPPAEILLSQLVKEFKEWAVNHWNYNQEAEVTVLVETPNASGLRWIAMDRKPNVSRFDCEFSFLVNQGGIVSHIRKHSPADYVFIGTYYGFERTLFRLHCAHTKLVIDEFDLLMPKSSDDD